MNLGILELVRIIRRVGFKGRGVVPFFKNQTKFHGVITNRLNASQRGNGYPDLTEMWRDDGGDMVTASVVAANSLTNTQKRKSESFSVKEFARLVPIIVNIDHGLYDEIITQIKRAGKIFRPLFVSGCTN